MDGGTTVSTTPMEWRSRVRVAAQARPVVFRERNIGKRILLLRKQLSRRLDIPGRRVKVKIQLRHLDLGWQFS